MTPLAATTRRAVFAWAACLLVLWSGSAGAAMLGANKFDLMLDFVAPSPPSGVRPEPYRIVREAMGRKAILDARDAGLGFLRVAVAGYGPADLKMWRSNPARFWGLLDRMFDALDAADMRLVPSFLWNISQFPALAGETVAAFIEQPQSAGRRLFAQFAREFIGRYKGRRTVLFYEMGNELNLYADLDEHKRNCPRDPCAWGNFTTAAMTRFAEQIVALIKSSDASRAVSSGYALPRPNAAHLAQHPEFAAGGPDWTPDTAEDFTHNLTATQAPFEVIGIHVYPGDQGRRTAGASGGPVDPVELAAQAAHAAGKKLFVGEFGDDKGATPFMRRTLDTIVRARVDFAAVWAWEFYQKSTTERVAGGMDLEPGFTDELIGLLIETERRLGAAPPPPAPAPRVVLTWPLPCAELAGPTELTAVASQGARAPERVEFLVDGAVLGTAAAPPYKVRFAPGGGAPRAAELTARAIGTSGSTASYRARVHLNGDAGPCRAAPD